MNLMLRLTVSMELSVHCSGDYHALFMGKINLSYKDLDEGIFRYLSLDF